MRKTIQRLKKTVKLLEYVLARNPDEYGLVLDDEGYVSIKEFISAAMQHPELRHIKKSTINEIVTSLIPCPIEVDKDRIRATAQGSVPVASPCASPPKRLYCCVRRRAHTHVIEKGLSHSGAKKIILSNQPEHALMIGKRKDPEPVLISINTQIAMDAGTKFLSYGQCIYMAESIPAEALSAPLPKQNNKEKKGAKKGKENTKNKARTGMDTVQSPVYDKNHHIPGGMTLFPGEKGGKKKSPWTDPYNRKKERRKKGKDKKRRKKRLQWPDE